MNFKTILTFFLSLAFFCCAKKTANAEQAYEYWAGSKPPNDIEVIEGEYYESPHFTLEYELSLKLKSNRKLFNDFVAQNGFVIDSVANQWTKPSELPEWFEPEIGSVVYCKDPTDKFDRSRYFYNYETGVWYIYETIGM